MKQRIISVLLTTALLCLLLPTAAFAEESAGKLDLSNGSIVITPDGYRQGTIDYGGSAKFGAAFSVKNGEGDVTETAYTGSYVITQSGGATSNGIRIEGLAANQTVTLNGVNITNPATGSGIVIWKGAAVRLLLAGENSVTGQSSNPGICVANGAVLTIGSGQADGLGKLTARGHSNAAGIGATNGNDAITGDGADYGSIIVNGGYIDTKGGNNAQASGIGSGYARAAAKVTVNGGIVYVPGGGSGICAKETVINGGNLIYTGAASNAVKKFKNDADNKEPVVTGGSLTSGSETYGTGGAQYRRVIIAFGDGSAAPKLLKNTEITVFPENNNSVSWRAYTDDNGLLYAYLPFGADQVTVQVPGEADTRKIGLFDNSTALNTVLSGIKCTCLEDHGTLSMTTKSQTVTTVRDSAVLTLAAAYTPSCPLPKGYGFHGDYENEPSYEVVSVVRAAGN